MLWWDENQRIYKLFGCSYVKRRGISKIILRLHK